MKAPRPFTVSGGLVIEAMGGSLAGTATLTVAVSTSLPTPLSVTVRVRTMLWRALVFTGAVHVVTGAAAFAEAPPAVAHIGIGVRGAAQRIRKRRDTISVVTVEGVGDAGRWPPLAYARRRPAQSDLSLASHGGGGQRDRSPELVAELLPCLPVVAAQVHRECRVLRRRAKVPRVVGHAVSEDPAQVEVPPKKKPL